LGVGAERESVDEEIESLLCHEPSRHAEHRHARVRRQPKPRLHCCLALPLAVEIARREARSDLRVVRGIPNVVVDAVRDAEQPVAQRAERVTKSEPAFRRLEFARVRRAHGHHGVGGHDAAFQPVHLVIPLEQLPIEQLPGEADLGHGAGRKMTLIPALWTDNTAGTRR